MQPLIGITPSPSTDTMGHGTFHRYCLSRTYVDSIRAAGGTPVVVPTDKPELKEILSRLDGLVLSGGGDLDPALFGDTEVHETTYGIDEERDSFEIEAFRFARDHDIPTLCICRGIQVMAIAQGGTLYQDIPSQVPNAIEHRQHNAGRTRDEAGHSVSISENNPLREIVGRPSFDVNSFHHQCVKEPGDRLVIVATATDDVIEALWHPDMQFGLGVQWHPEMLSGHFPAHASIFRAFVNEAARVPATK